MSMSMARNDIERALRDVLSAGENDDPDFSYVGEPVEAEDWRSRLHLTANVKHGCSS
jgi:hypothetical protein